MINRRQFLQMTSAGALSLAAEGLGSLLAAPSVFAEVNAGSEFEPDLDISLTAQPTQVPIFPGTPTFSCQMELNAGLSPGAPRK